MTIMTHTNGAGSRSEAGFVKTIRDAVADRIAYLKRYNEYASAEASLHALSDYELADIGLTRDVIHERVWRDFERR